MIHYIDAYILLNIECEIPYDDGDQGEKSIPDVLYLKNSFELIIISIIILIIEKLK